MAVVRTAGRDAQGGWTARGPRSAKAELAVPRAGASGQRVSGAALGVSRSGFSWGGPLQALHAPVQTGRPPPASSLVCTPPADGAWLASAPQVHYGLA